MASHSALASLFSCGDFEAAAGELARTSTSASRRGALANISGGACDGETLARNLAAFRDWVLVPRSLVDVSLVSTATTILGHRVSQPFGIAPSAYQLLVHEDGELGMTRAAVACGVAHCLSSSATTSLEAVAAEAAGGGLRLMQVYAMTDRAVTRRLVERAERAGFAAIVLTVDRPVLGRREAADRLGFDNRPAIQADPNGLAPPSAAGSGGGGGAGPLYNSRISAALTWDDVAWLRAVTRLPVVVKGVLSPVDAALAVRAGVAAVWISNHGGRQLDGAVASLDVLPACVAAVRAAEASLGTPEGATGMRRIEVWVDGGVRRGTDVIKALALGADFVFVGRPPLWGLAVGGAAGAQRVLELLGAEVHNAMALLGVTSVRGISRELVELARSPGAGRDRGISSRSTMSDSEDWWHWQQPRFQRTKGLADSPRL